MKRRKQTAAQEELAGLVGRAAQIGARKRSDLKRRGSIVSPELAEAEEEVEALARRAGRLSAGGADGVRQAFRDAAGPEVLNVLKVRRESFYPVSRHWQAIHEKAKSVM